MGSKEELKECLQILAHENGSSKEFRSTVETLLKVHRNILYNPGNEKYCRLNLSGKIMQNLWMLNGARLFLTRTGWQQEKDCLLFLPEQDDLLPQALHVLQDFRLIAPEAREWIDENKIEDLTKHIIKEEEARAEAAKEREKELKAFYTDQKERTELAATIRKQIKEDAKARKLKPPYGASKSKSTGSIVVSNSAFQAAKNRLGAISTTHHK